MNSTQQMLQHKNNTSFKTCCHADVAPRTAFAKLLCRLDAGWCPCRSLMTEGPQGISTTSVMCCFARKIQPTSKQQTKFSFQYRVPAYVPSKLGRGLKVEARGSGWRGEANAFAPPFKCTSNSLAAGHFFASGLLCTGSCPDGTAFTGLTGESENSSCGERTRSSPGCRAGL